MKHCLLFLFVMLSLFIFAWIALWGVFILALETFADHRTSFVFGVFGLVYIVSLLHRLLGWLYRRYLEKL